MKVLIIEDEKPAARRLQQLLQQQRPQTDVLAFIDSVERATQWFRSNPRPDLMFLDIQLADGLSFDIFREVEVQAPVIFTTAYDQYTLRAFKLNSVDYLLKPIDPEELERALAKFDRFFGKAPLLDTRALESLIQSFQAPEYKERFIVKAGQITGGHALGLARLEACPPRVAILDHGQALGQALRHGLGQPGRRLGMLARQSFP